MTYKLSSVKALALASCHKQHTEVQPISIRIALAGPQLYLPCIIITTRYQNTKKHIGIALLPEIISGFK